ncbi:hypothetical protein [Sphingomonas radiodurans]|uniref:hypothetical protein n=1 Tax=Sphingomonas radiodurans TaxID=2890321 RepID=UPI001E3FF3A8|nr:hypothetical protein [Sphingomonas radiodurans]WBH15785.1 hypothetical protein LLW23_13310 [Sphingomonas radiodurans]
MSRVSQVFAVVALVAMTACASKPKQVAVAPPPPAPVVPVYVAPPISPINRSLSNAATVWHVRAALNVAALACRGAQEGAIIQRYNAMLTAHKATLAGAQATLSAEFKAGGGDWQDRYDDAMTRLYNFFSQAQARDAFCTAAAATLAETETLAPGEFQAYAAAVLPTLDAPFAEMLAPRPVIAVASAGMAPMVAPVAARAPAPVMARAAPVVARAPAAVVPAAPLPAVGTRAVAQAMAPATTKVVPKLELDLSVLQD